MAINELSRQIAERSGVSTLVELVPQVGDKLGPAGLGVVSVGNEEETYRVFNNAQGEGVCIPGGTVLDFGGGILFRLENGNLAPFHATIDNQE